jgi:hypothetical protein
MKQPPDENKLYELLELAKDLERKGKELHDMGEAFAQKYEKRISEIRAAKTQKH